FNKNISPDSRYFPDSEWIRIFHKRCACSGKKPLTFSAKDPGGIKKQEPVNEPVTEHLAAEPLSPFEQDRLNPATTEPGQQIIQIDCAALVAADQQFGPLFSQSHCFCLVTADRRDNDRSFSGFAHEPAIDRGLERAVNYYPDRVFAARHPDGKLRVVCEQRA